MRAKLTHENPPYEEAPCLYPNYLDRWKAILKIIFVGFSVAGQVAIVFDLFGADLKRTCRARMRTVNGYDLGADDPSADPTLITSRSRGSRGPRGVGIIRPLRGAIYMDVGADCITTASGR